MNSEKLKEIKEALECCKDRLCEVCPRLKQEPNQEEDCRLALIGQSLTLINELERENEKLNNELKRYKLDWLNSEKMHLQADMEDTEFELFCSNKSLNEVRAENKKLKDRIAELEKELTNDRVFYKDGICYPMNCQGALKQFAERLKEKGQKAFINIGGLTASAKTVTLHDIDETLKEFIND